LAAACPKCGGANLPEEQFCGDCGALLKESATLGRSIKPAALNLESAAPEAVAGERKTLTALFADLKGSTELLETLDPEEGRAIVEPLLRIMSDAVGRYEGYLMRTTGDGIFALFGAPVAYEDHPQRALYAALQMQKELRSHVQAQAAKGRPALEARVGVHTGEVVAYAGEVSGKIEYRLIGHTANLASRMESIAPSGSVAISEATAELCEGYFELRGLGPTAVKGVSTLVSVYEVLGRGPLRTHFELSTRRGLTRFVGRERELDQMRHALEQSMAGHGQIVAVVAEAGTGKSRLFYEFKATIPADCKVLDVYSVSHGKASPWLPVLELLRGYFGITETDDAASRREKVRAIVTSLDAALQDTLPYLFGLLAIHDGPDPYVQMDARIKHQRTLEATKRILLRDSLEHPLVVVFEDLHWIDDQTQALLDLLADSIASTRLLLLFNYRPEYRHEWTNKSYYTQLRLEPLGNDDGAAMLTALLGDGLELAALKRMIAERTGGNPFFIEEIVQGLFEDGALVRNGTVRITRSLSQLRLPPTVQGMLAARIDRLPRPQKDLLQTLAVIGREARLRLVRQVTSLDEVLLSQDLAQLCAAEFIHEQPMDSDTEFVFKHALTQDVAYYSLLIERRKQIHGNAGQALESIYADQLEDHLGELAHHYSHSDNLEKAFDYLARAGQRALQLSACAEAITNLSRAIELLQRLPRTTRQLQQELPLQLTIGSAYIALKGWGSPEAEKAYARARELGEQVGDAPELFPALFGMWGIYNARGNIRTSYPIAQQLMRSAQQANDEALVMYANIAMGNAAFDKAELTLAQKHMEQALALYNRERHHRLAAHYGGLDAGLWALCVVAPLFWRIGYPDRAIQRGNEMLDLARQLRHPPSQAFAEALLAILRWHRREPSEALQAAEIAIALSGDQGIDTLVVATVMRGWAMAEQGRAEEGIAQIREAVSKLWATGGHVNLPMCLSALTEVCIKWHRLDDALGTLAEMESISAANSDLRASDHSEIERLKGDLLLMVGDGPRVAEAKNCFEHAIHKARTHGAKSFELRATTSLARLLIKQGRREEARSMLVEIYNWFTEGFDTADLKDAKALLDELSV
jgi:class 3 adenylate cyclase